MVDGKRLMKRVSESGRSFLSTMGLVFAITSIVLMAGVGYSFYWHYQKICEITGAIGDFFREYQTNAADLIKTQAHMNGPLFLKNYGMVKDCSESTSMFDHSKVVCKFPLGEWDLNTSFDEPYLHTQVYVHFNDPYKRLSCQQFLNVAWQDILPSYFWGENGYIGVIAEDTKGKMYFSHNLSYIQKDGAQKRPTHDHTRQVCKLCRKSRYCSVIFSFEIKETDLSQVNFPAEFAGDKSNSDKLHPSKVQKNGNTYTKTTGDISEVVTYGQNGTFSGTVYTGGSVDFVYDGTYTPQGITSYTRYASGDRSKIDKQINNIAYDSKGHVQSYQKGAQKFLLIGNADDCLIVDEDNNAKHLGKCQELFNNEVSSFTLDYDEQGRLRTVKHEGAQDDSYTLTYDETSGALKEYCRQSDGQCFDIKDNQTLQDILAADIPSTLDQLTTRYDLSDDKPQKPKRRIYTKEEALKAVKETGNTVRMKFK